MDRIMEGVSERIQKLRERVKDQPWYDEGRRRRIVIPPAFAAWDIATLPRVPHQRAVIEGAQRYLSDLGSHLHRGEGGVIFGPVGAGKTQLLACIAQAVSDRGVDVVFTGAVELMARVRGEKEDELSRHMRVRALFVHDVSALRLTDWAAEVLYRLINHRYEAKLPTWIDSMGGAGEMANLIGMPLWSRLAERAKGRVWELAAVDMRVRGSSHEA